MNSVRPLTFLLTRTIFNGVKRATTSPKRLIGLLFFTFYYWNVVMRPFEPHRQRAFPSTAPHLALPSATIVEAIVFGIVGFMSLLLMSSVFSYRGGFKPADVDVMFATPIDPKVVLFFRIARDTLATLLLPLFLAVVGFRGASMTLGSLFRDYPKQGGDILRAFLISYLLVSFVWVCVGYAASLFIGRSDFDSDRNRKRINWGMAAYVIALMLYIALRLRADLSTDTLLAITQSPFVRIMLAPVTLATWTVMGVYQGAYGTAVLGLVGLASLIGIALAVALTQVGWMYDQAAVRGFESGPNLRDLQRRGDTIGILAERARQGKLKHGRISRRIAQMKVRGAATLLWKEAILQSRGSLSSLFFLGTMFLIIVGLAMWAFTNDHSGKQLGTAGWMIMFLQAMMVYALAMMSGQSGFLEFLRRVDVQKPLPFTPATTVFYEVLSKAIPPTILSLLAAVIGVVMLPAVWPNAVASVLLTPALAVLITSVLLLVIVLFPDVEDPTQRMFRGFMTLLALSVCLLPGFAIMALLCLAAGISPILAALPTAVVCLGISVGICVVSGGLYAGYNPSE